MIEDLQDEYSLYSKEKSAPTRKSALILVMFVIWIMYATVIVLAARSSIRKSLRETNALEIVQNVGHYRVLAESGTRTLYFFSNSNGLSPYSVLVQNTGATEYHDVIEGLLAGPPDSVLETGAVSFIAPGTRLLGLTVSEKTAFVNFSQEIAPPEDMAVALAQITLTLKAVNPYIEETVVLVNGAESSLTP